MRDERRAAAFVQDGLICFHFWSEWEKNNLDIGVIIGLIEKKSSWRKWRIRIEIEGISEMALEMPGKWSCFRISDCSATRRVSGTKLA